MYSVRVCEYDSVAAAYDCDVYVDTSDASDVEGAFDWPTTYRPLGDVDPVW